MAEVYIALGSNMDSPHSQLDSALEALAQHPRIDLIATSSRYQTPPIGPQQPDFINAAAQLSTDLSPLDLLDALQTIEHQKIECVAFTGARGLWIWISCSTTIL